MNTNLLQNLSKYLTAHKVTTLLNYKPDNFQDDLLP